MAASDSPGAIITFFVLTTLIVLSTLVVCVLLVTRRHVYPLNGRDLSLIIPIQILILFNVCVTAVRALSPPPCEFSMVPGIFVPAIVIVCMIFRLLRLVFIYKFAQEKLELHKALREESASNKVLSANTPEVTPEGLIFVENIRELRSMEVVKVNTKRIDTLVENIAEKSFAHDEELLLKHGAVLSMLRDDEKKEPSKWFANHRYMIESAWMWKVIAPLSFAFIFIGSLVYGVSTDLPNGDSEDGPCPRYERTLTVQAILFALLFVILVYTIWLVRNVQDGFFIKQEFKYFGMSFVVMMIFPFLRGVDSTITFPVIEFFVLVGYTVTLSTVGLYPLYLSYSEEFISPLFSSLSSGSDELGDAKGVPIFVFLTDERYAMERHDFETMLIKEFSVENLLFFHAVRRFEQMKVDKKIREDPDAKCELPKIEPCAVPTNTDACQESMGASELPAVSLSKTGSTDTPASVAIDKESQEESDDESKIPETESGDSSDTGSFEKPEAPLSEREPVATSEPSKTEERKVSMSNDASEKPELSLSGEHAKTESCVVLTTTDVCEKTEISFCGKESVEVVDTPMSVLQFGMEAMEIYQQFVWRGAPYQVNLSHQVLNPIEREILEYFGKSFVKAYCEADGETLSTIKLEKTDPIRQDIFSKAQKHILKLLATDTYLRWKINRSRERSKSIAERSRKDPVIAHFDESSHAHVSV